MKSKVQNEKNYVAIIVQLTVDFVFVCAIAVCHFSVLPGKIPTIQNRFIIDFIE